MPIGPVLAHVLLAAHHLHHAINDLAEQERQLIQTAATTLQREDPGRSLPYRIQTNHGTYIVECHVVNLADGTRHQDFFVNWRESSCRL